MTRMASAANPLLCERVRELLRSLGEEPDEPAEVFSRRVAEAAAECEGEPDVMRVASRLLAQKIRQTRFELKERVLELESLYDLGLAVAGTLDVGRLADEILLRSISLTNSRSGALHLIDEKGLSLSRSFGGPLLSADAAVRMVLAADSVINNEAASTPTCGVRLEGCRKCLVVPIQNDGRRLGVLAVADKETRDGAIGDFTEGDARLLSLFANQAATALEAARLHRQAIERERLEKELELAAAIQREILPRDLPRVPGLDIAARTRPTRQVGGDYFDVFLPAENAVAFVVADVSGKGVPAALMVSTLASAVRLQIEDAGDPADLIARVHRHLFRFSRARKFSTLFFGRFSLGTGELQYVSAGHNPAVILRAGGAFDVLEATGHPVGMFQDSRWAVGVSRLEPGDRLCVYTDGITEAQNAAQEDFGLLRLQDTLVRFRPRPLSDVLEGVLSEVARFAEDVPQYDDQTLLLVARETAPAR
jgi:sigma-B regulation protein RsbU (phosphoserine phosphatase)